MRTTGKSQEVSGAIVLGEQNLSIRVRVDVEDFGQSITSDYFDIELIEAEVFSKCETGQVSEWLAKA
jgi:hypothetical protein